MKNEQHEVMQISESSWIIQEEDVRSFLFVGNECALLVDTGCLLTDMKELVESITPLPLVVVNTHADVDHIAGNEQFAAIYMHPAEFPFYHKVQKRTANLHPLWEGDSLDLGGRTFEVIAIPGHTPGSVALLDGVNRILVGGDSVQDGSVFLFGAERDLMAYRESLKKLLRRADRFDTIYASHASVSVESGILPGLIRGVEDILKGKIKGTPSAYMDTPILTYDIGVATILYDHDICFPLR